MTALAKKMVKLVEHLPAEDAKAVLDFASYLAEKSAGEAWEHRLTHPRYTRRFKARLKKVDRAIEGGHSQDFDLQKL